MYQELAFALQQGGSMPDGTSGVPQQVPFVRNPYVVAEIVVYEAEAVPPGGSGAAVMEIQHGADRPGIFTVRRNEGQGGVDNPADIVIIDPAEEWIIDKKRFASKGRNTPFDGWKVRGRVKCTICDGEIVYKDGGFDFAKP